MAVIDPRDPTDENRKDPVFVSRAKDARPNVPNVLGELAPNHKDDHFLKKMHPEPKRNWPGWSRYRRKLQFHELFWPIYDPRAFTSEKPPANVQSALEDVFGDETKGEHPDVMVAFHPGFRRWALWNRVRAPRLQTEYGWKCVSIFMEPKKEGYLPPDLDRDNKRWEHCRGEIGDYRLPHKRDFEIIKEKADRWRLTKYEIDENLSEEDVKKEKEREAEEYDRLLDFHEYYANLAINEANQRAGCGNKMQSFATVEVKKNPEIYYLKQKDGYLVRTKRNSIMAQRLEWEEQVEQALQIPFEIQRKKRLEELGCAHLAEPKAEGEPLPENWAELLGERETEKTEERTLVEEKVLEKVP